MNEKLFDDLREEYPYGSRWRAEYDGYVGTVIGWYVTREGRPGLDLQLDNARVVHVYGLKHLTALDDAPATLADETLSDEEVRAIMDNACKLNAGRHLREFAEEVIAMRRRLRELEGRWPHWGDRPDGFDGPGGAE